MQLFNVKVSVILHLFVALCRLRAAFGLCDTSRRDKFSENCETIDSYYYTASLSFFISI